jgi:hypothetical protein
MRLDRNTILALVVALAAGYWLASSPSSPIAPVKDRPVLRMLARMAKGFLWVALVAEQPPESVEETYLVHARLGEDGQPLLNHARGW